MQTVRAMSWDAAAKLGRAAWAAAANVADRDAARARPAADRALRGGGHGVGGRPDELAADDVQRVDVAGRRAEALHRGLARAAQARQVIADARALVTDVNALAELAVADATIDLYEGRIDPRWRRWHRSSTGHPAVRSSAPPSSVRSA